MKTRSEKEAIIARLILLIMLGFVLTPLSIIIVLSW
jgi:hypothetical protein